MRVIGVISDTHGLLRPDVHSALAGVEGGGSFYRIVVNSGEDYLYPASHFKVV
jgi:hypothetical protein